MIFTWYFRKVNFSQLKNCLFSSSYGTINLGTKRDIATIYYLLHQLKRSTPGVRGQENQLLIVNRENEALLNSMDMIRKFNDLIPAKFSRQTILK